MSSYAYSNGSANPLTRLREHKQYAFRRLKNLLLVLIVRQDTVWAYEPALVSRTCLLQNAGSEVSAHERQQGTTATFTVTYPTLHVNYDESTVEQPLLRVRIPYAEIDLVAHWQGVMPARSGNSSQCLSAGPGMAADSIFPSHPLPPQPTGGVVDNADPRGWHYRMVVQKFFDYTAITDVFPTFAPLSCVHDTRPPAAAAEPVSTAMFVTVSTVSLRSCNKAMPTILLLTRLY